jgi:hypothetical protein
MYQRARRSTQPLGMTPAHALVTIVHAGSVGLGITVFLWLSWSPCDAKAFLFEFPAHALAGTPPALTEAPWLSECESQTTPLRTWLLLWGPIGAFVAVAGGIAMRRTGLLSAGALGGVVAGAIPMGVALSSQLGFTPLPSVAGWNAIALSLMLVAVAGVLGLGGAWTWRRHA